MLRKTTFTIGLLGTASLLAMPAEAIAQDQALEQEVESLREQVAQLKAREAHSNERLQALETRLLQMEVEPISTAEAGSVRGRYVPEPQKPHSTTSNLDFFRNGRVGQGFDRLAQITNAQDPDADLVSGRTVDEEPVQKAPNPTEAVQDIVQQQQGTQRSRFGAELAVGYSHFGDARINLDGFLALDAIFLGTISIDEVDADILTTEATLRYGLTDDLFFDVSAPFLYRTSTFRSGGAGGAANQPVEVTKNHGGIGDMSIGASYQILRETASRPNIVLSGRVKFPTGREPYGIDFVEVEGSEGNLQVPATLATGSGVYGASLGISALKTIDPMVVFGSLNYFYNFERNFADIDENPGDQPGRVDIGNALQFGAGLAFALNEKSSISMSYSQRLVERSRLRLEGLDWQRVIGSQANVALVNMGATFSVAEAMSLITTVGIGLTDDSPDMVVGLRVPYRF
ncbi:hypothetical protein P7228_08000 [Altererythrobacter arenosus]|uniref:Transporter n=1 Tax=Altererythrobacter arenosus TaxID=3032592 RepID=A0ABY8FLQ8_9SPHN|nr:transporter [Altererythrobacter sp. CAU 1644]WFL75953.1 hypothetical protein P7228_08000 [Altererythrobacter sp. CAU 1644]